MTMDRITQLKAQAYDLLVMLEQTKAQLDQVNQALHQELLSKAKEKAESTSTEVAA